MGWTTKAEGEQHGCDRASGDCPVRFHDGAVEEFKRLSAECMQIVRTTDTGTLQYDTYFNDDETECIVIERFRDSDALIDHGENLAHLMERSSRPDRCRASFLVTRVRSSGRGPPAAARSSSSRPGWRCSNGSRL